VRGVNYGDGEEMDDDDDDDDDDGKAVMQHPSGSQVNGDTPNAYQDLEMEDTTEETSGSIEVPGVAEQKDGSMLQSDAATQDTDAEIQDVSFMMSTDKEQVNKRNRDDGIGSASDETRDVEREVCEEDQGRALDEENTPKKRRVSIGHNDLSNDSSPDMVTDGEDTPPKSPTTAPRVVNDASKAHANTAATAGNNIHDPMDDSKPAAVTTVDRPMQMVQLAVEALEGPNFTMSQVDDDDDDMRAEPLPRNPRIESADRPDDRADDAGVPVESSTAGQLGAPNNLEPSGNQRNGEAGDFDDVAIVRRLHDWKVAAALFIIVVVVGVAVALATMMLMLPKFEAGGHSEEQVIYRSPREFCLHYPDVGECRAQSVDCRSMSCQIRWHFS
jgi:hypothetical protein